MKKHFFAAFVLLAILLAVLIVLNMSIGSVTISPAQVWAALTEKGNSMNRSIILQMRLPRALAAGILGGGLALSGYLLQTFFHNPIAGPFTLGISSGAKLAVAMAMVVVMRHSSSVSSVLMIGAAFCGAFISMGFVLLMARVVDQMSVLIVSGVMVGYICSAITDFVVTFASDADIVNLHNWSRGSFSGTDWADVRVISATTLITVLLVFFLSKPISAYQMGEQYAAGMGLNVKLFRVVLVLLSSVLSACVTAFAGPISFVGIAVPQLLKGLFRTAKPIVMIPACFLGGGVFCLFCDLLARTVFSPTELSISTVTAIFGAPVVIVILLRRKLNQGG